MARGLFSWTDIILTTKAVGFNRPTAPESTWQRPEFVTKTAPGPVSGPQGSLRLGWRPQTATDASGSTGGPEGTDGP